MEVVQIEGIFWNRLCEENKVQAKGVCVCVCYKCRAGQVPTLGLSKIGRRKKRV